MSRHRPIIASAAAVLTLQAAAAAELDSPEFLKGMECSQTKQYTKAVRYFNEAIKGNPTSLKYHYQRAVAYLQLKDKEEALPDLQFCSRQNPGFKIEPRFWAQAYRAAGQFTQAIIKWNEAIKLEPRDVDLYYGRAQTYVESEQFAKAAEDYSEAIKIRPYDDHYFSERADCYVQLKQYDKAVSDYEMTLKKNPANNGVYLHRANCYLYMSRYKEAVSDYTKAISIKPKEPKAYALRAKAYDKMGRKDLADQDRKKAREIGEDFSL